MKDIQRLRALPIVIFILSIALTSATSFLIKVSMTQVLMALCGLGFLFMVGTVVKAHPELSKTSAPWAQKHHREILFFVGITVYSLLVIERVGAPEALKPYWMGAQLFLLFAIYTAYCVLTPFYIMRGLTSLKETLWCFVGGHLASTAVTLLPFFFEGDNPLMLIGEVVFIVVALLFTGVPVFDSPYKDSPNGF